MAQFKIKMTKAQQKEFVAYKQGKIDGYKIGFKAGEESIIKKLKEAEKNTEGGRI